jgi:uncharacterized protein (DUF1919 family)
MNHHRVKISELPIDMSEGEMCELLNEWGRVYKCKVINYENASVSFIDFENEEQANYFVKALDNTPFDHKVIRVSRVD